MRSSSRALRLELAGHAVEGVDQAPQLVDRAHRDAGVEIAARDALRRARQPADGIGDALGQRQAERRPEQDEAQHGEVDAAIEIVDLALDVPLAERRGHGQDALAVRSVRTGVAAIRYGVEPKTSSATKLGSRSQHDGAIDGVRRSRRQQARREEIELARGDELRAVEDVDVLIDHLADPHHHVVGALDAVSAAIEERVRLFDDALRHRGGARGFALNVLAQEIGKVGADDERQDEHGNDRGEDERQEQLAVEAGANLAEQGPADARPLATEPGEDRGRQQHEHEGRAGERADLGEMHQVIEQREPRVADGIDAGAVVGEVDLIRVFAERDAFPERLARRIVDALERALP